MTITVYSKPACVQCKATTRALDAAGLSYEYRDVMTSDEWSAEADRLSQTLGRQMPLVVTDRDQWGGFRPDRIKALKGGEG